VGSIYVGNEVGQFDASGCQNVAMGTCSFRNANGAAMRGNVIVGFRAGDVTKGCYNVIFGVETGRCSGCAGTYPKCSIIIGPYANQYGSCGNKGDIFIGSFAGRSVGQTSISCHSTYLGIAAGQQTTASGYNTGASCFNLVIGGYSKVYGTAPKFQTIIATDGQGAGDCQVVIGVSSTTNIYLCGTVSKSSGTFRIVHPNPKKKGKFLYHSFVEGPTRGENFYRWSVDVSGGSYSMKLPNYYKYLNENSMAWIYPVDHFGEGHAKVDDTGDNLNICADRDGRYNVLLIGTRCDEFALKHWKGTESDMDEGDIRRVAELRKEGVYK